MRSLESPTVISDVLLKDHAFSCVYISITHALSRIKSIKGITMSHQVQSQLVASRQACKSKKWCKHCQQEVKIKNFPAHVVQCKIEEDTRLKRLAAQKKN
jgi:hypothetical protein